MNFFLIPMNVYGNMELFHLLLSPGHFFPGDIKCVWKNPVQSIPNTTPRIRRIFWNGYKVLGDQFFKKYISFPSFADIFSCAIFLLCVSELLLLVGSLCSSLSYLLDWVPLLPCRQFFGGPPQIIREKRPSRVEPGKEGKPGPSEWMK